MAPAVECAQWEEGGQGTRLRMSDPKGTLKGYRCWPGEPMGVGEPCVGFGFCFLEKLWLLCAE